MATKFVKKNNIKKIPHKIIQISWRDEGCECALADRQIEIAQQR